MFVSHKTNFRTELSERICVKEISTHKAWCDFPFNLVEIIYQQKMLNLFIFLLIIQSIYGSNPPSSELYMKYGSHALNALRRLLNFFETDAQNLNLDGLYGLRIAQGQLNALDQYIRSSSQQENKLTDRNQIIQSLSRQIERIANGSLNEIQRDDSAYLHRFALVAYQPFVIEYRAKKIPKYLIETQERTSDFDEQQSDQCFAELLGSSNQPNSKKCFITTSCWNMMTSSLGEDYRLTHQLLWFLVAKNIGCITEHLSNRKLEYFEDYFCANIYQDAQYNLENNINQDLFLEQLLLCSISGYHEFLRFDWLNTILAWQDSEYGCFSDASETIRFHRHLLVEQEMNHACLSHKSGLAAGLLASYSRFFLQ